MRGQRNRRIFRQAANGNSSATSLKEFNRWRCKNGWIIICSSRFAWKNHHKGQSQTSRLWTQRETLNLNGPPSLLGNDGINGIRNSSLKKAFLCIKKWIWTRKKLPQELSSWSPGSPCYKYTMTTFGKTFFPIVENWVWKEHILDFIVEYFRSDRLAPNQT